MSMCRNQPWPRITGALLGLSLASVAAAIWGCASKPREVQKVEAVPLRDVPRYLRGTIGAEAAINGTEPQLVSGLGIVVGLNGTGGGEIWPEVFATMERELARNGVGRGSNAGGSLSGLSPQELLRDPNVAVVIVEARIPPGAPEGTVFDVYVRTLPGSTVSSLEGGQLWTTELRLGPATVFGGYKTRLLAVARGPIYVNPFSDQGSGEVGVTRTSGRVLGGGRVTDPLKLELVLDSDSHARARSVVAAVNSRFPRDPGEPGQTARGRGQENARAADGSTVSSTQSVAISVPRRYSKDASEFLQLLRFTRVDQSYPQEFAKAYTEELKVNPAAADQLCWCLKAVGKTAVPFLVPLYDYPEYAPRMAALEAGAFHGDARCVPHLVELAKGGPSALRTQSIKLLAKMPPNPTINVALRDMVSAPELDVRVAAYEALSDRQDPIITRVPIGEDKRQPKFVLESVPAADPMVYVTQQGEPRIVIFGGDVASQSSGVRVNKPTLVSAWKDGSGDRFILSAEGDRTDLRLYYRNGKSGEVVKQKVKEDLAEFVHYLAHKPTPEEPEPGLNFTYSEVVGALYEMSRQSGISATFATEQDKLRAEIFEAAQATALSDRPEASDGSLTQPIAESKVFRPTEPAALPSAADPTRTGDHWQKPRIVPLTKPKAKADASK